MVFSFTTLPTCPTHQIQSVFDNSAVISALHVIKLKSFHMDQYCWIVDVEIKHGLGFLSFMIYTDTQWYWYNFIFPQIQYSLSYTTVWCSLIFTGVYIECEMENHFNYHFTYHSYNWTQSVLWYIFYKLYISNVINIQSHTW